MPSNSTAKGNTLLPMARAAIAGALGQAQSDCNPPRWLEQPGASFVTLTQDGALRGCIGSLEARRPLHIDVKSNAVAAALHDPRFAPLTFTELECTRIEVSLVSPMQPMRFSSQADALSQLRPGVDGVVFEYAHYRSTFLPQVWEQLPDTREFLAHLKHKAGLPMEFWADQVRLTRYTVRKWHESGAQTSGAAP
jgi:AmmeMemoRadiSam system protein A